MKNITIVKKALYKLFKEYLAGELCEMAFESRLQSLCRGEGNKYYWWRFFDNDTAANDYWSVRSSLKIPNNTKYLKECISIALNKKQLTVYYS